jgi:hypothetical protein
MAGDIRYLTSGSGDGVRHMSIPAAEVLSPVRYRTWGIPTGAGWFSMPWKWNFIGEPVMRKWWWVFGALALMLHG